MPRTIDPTAYAVRRDAFLDVAERLFVTKGYEETSIQDVLDAADASRGAFYHYFDSKGALLEAVIDRMAGVLLAAIVPVAVDPDIPALAKLQRTFAEAGRRKAERKDLMVAIQRSWYADRNTVVRERLERRVVARLAATLAGVVRQGTAEGVFTATSPDHAAEVLLALLVGSGDTLGRLFLACFDGAVPVADVERSIAAYDEAIERILGLPPGSFELVDAPTLRFWFA
jgi:AcrR family transcriptional regulator